MFSGGYGGPSFSATTEWQNMAGTNPAVAAQDCTNPAQPAPSYSQDVPAERHKETENPGALAGAAGAKIEVEGFCEGDYPAESPAARAVPLPGIWRHSRFLWSASINGSDLTPMARVLANVIVQQATDRLSGACYWTRAQFAVACNVSEDTIKRLFRALEEAGYLKRRVAQGRGSRSRLVFMLPFEKAAEIAATTARGHEAPRPVAPGQSAQSAPFSRPEQALANVKKGGEIAPFSRSEKGADLPGKGGEIAPPILIPKKIPNMRTPAQASAREAVPPDRTTAASARTANRLPERPRLNLAAVAHHGSDRERAWDEWLRSKGFPKLAELGVKSSDAGGRGWEIPYRYPPTEHNAVESMMAHRWAQWALARMEVQNVSS